MARTVADSSPDSGVSDLGARGRSFYLDVTTEFEMDRAERELLAQVCRLLDRLDELRAAIAADGLMVESSRGASVNPAVGEERQCSLALGRLLAQLQVPAAGESTAIASPTTVRARTAARARWAAS